MAITILGIESSCDDTSAAIVRDGKLLSNKIANQEVHRIYGGVVPELASRAHQQNIIPVVDRVFKEAGISVNEIDGVAFTRGPGLMGSLLVGTSFSKGFALARGIPLIGVNHLQGHVLVHFLKDGDTPAFPFICLLVSGGHTQILIVRDYLKMEILGQTIDDAAGEAFDKCGKVMGLTYPAGPHIDRLAMQGNPNSFTFSKPRIKDFNFSFSGLKTSFLYFIRDRLKENPDFISDNLSDLCASLQKTIIDILLEKLVIVSNTMKIKEIALAGGVSANSGLRHELENVALERNWTLHLPRPVFTTDNAAMIAITGYFKYLQKDFANQDIAPLARI